MSQINRVKLVVLVLFLAGSGAVLFTNNFVNRPVSARSAGPDAGFTGAPGEDPEACAACHLPQGTSSGTFTITAPQTYLPGQTYQIIVRHASSDQTRMRWGFQLTTLDDGNEKAGNLQTSSDGRTQLLNNQGPGNNRQYIEHTSSGTFAGQHDAASRSFTWTAPTQNIGPITFYAAGNQANWDIDNTGDFIYKT